MICSQVFVKKKHSTVTATMKVLNDFICAIDSKEYCAALFLDLSKAFDTLTTLSCLRDWWILECL